jgi:hypothetical protein
MFPYKLVPFSKERGVIQQSCFSHVCQVYLYETRRKWYHKQSCQQATFFQPDLACGLAWSNWSCLACQAKNQGAACAWPGLAWPGLAWPAGQTKLAWYFWLLTFSSGPLDQSIGKMFHFQQKCFTPHKVKYVKQKWNIYIYIYI